MSFYSKLAATALSKLTKYGQPVILRAYSANQTDYDPTTGLATPSIAPDEIRNALVTDQPGSQIAQRFGQTLQNGSLVQTADKWVYLDANGSVPKLQDHIIIAGVDYSVVNVQVTGPGGIPLFYLLVLRA